MTADYHPQTRSLVIRDVLIWIVGAYQIVCCAVFVFGLWWASRQK